MRRLYKMLFFIAGLLGISQAYAQQYGNEWIDYSKTYYKFRVGKNGIFRIYKAALDAAGVPVGTPGSQFVLYSRGQQIPIYVTTDNTFSTNDYIEFYGKMNDGKQDTELYGDPNIQPNDRMSLFSDTASYYLTYDNSTNPHSHYVGINNPISGTPVPVPYCMFTYSYSFKNVFTPGYSYASGYSFPSSHFDRGEGFVQQFFPPSYAPVYTLLAPNLVPNGQAATISTGVAAFSYYNNHYLKINLSGNLIADSAYGPVDTKRFSLSVPASSLVATNPVQYAPYNAGTGYDQWGVSFIELIYPRSFDVSGVDYFEFNLPAAVTATSNYVEFTTYSGGAPRLYDVTNQKWYTGDVTSVPGKARFLLDPTGLDREMVLYAPTSTNITSLSSVKNNIHFTDYSQTANQGNYVIVSHSQLMQSSSGNNFVNDYKTYRSSANGGSYQVVVADVSELYDQFSWGIDNHSSSIKHFMKYAYDKWTRKPEFLFLIGRGMSYSNYPGYLANPSSYPYPIVPTYGEPGADLDFVTLNGNRSMNISVGRFSAWNGDEIGIYLDKIKSFEAALKSPALPTYLTELWKKTVLHIAGSSDASLQQSYLIPTLNSGAVILNDTSMGANTTLIAKNTTNPVDNIGSATIDSMINAGLSLISFNGHASSAGFDFNLNNPEQYHSSPRFPFFIGLGCDVATIFSLLSQKTISERYLDATTGGSTGMIAANNINFPDFHTYYYPAMCGYISKLAYGKTIGEQYRYSYDSMMTYAHTYDSITGPGITARQGYFMTHLESLLLQGDPALHVYSSDKPDYHVSVDGISTVPTPVTTSGDSFKLKIVNYNLAKAISDTVILKVEHINPAGTVVTIGNYPLVNLYNSDTILVSVPINHTADLGLNKYRVTIDAPNKYDEVSETNNTATLELFIYSDNLIPVYPYEFSIVNQQNITLKASTLNPFRPVGKYRLQIDTTMLFNSPLLQQTAVTSPSGVISWTPTMSYRDSTVYYWRTTYDSAINGNYNWSASSFIYLAQGTPGWNQSHYYQYQKDGYSTLSLDSDRKFRFGVTYQSIEVWNKIAISGADASANVQVKVDDVTAQYAGCNLNGTIQVMVFDSATGKPWVNANPTATGSLAPCFSNTVDYNCFEYSLNTAASRDAARRFIDSIPSGNYVMIRNYVLLPGQYYQPSYVDQWKADTLIYGSGNSLYHSIYNLGFNLVDSMSSTRVFVFFSRKHRTDFPLFQQVGPTNDNSQTTGLIHQLFKIPVRSGNGELLSTVIGPALQWQNLKWRTSALDTGAQYDSSYVHVVGIDNNSNETSLYTGISRDTSLSWIDAKAYPKIRLEWYGRDTILRSSPQLNYWRVLYSPAPEAALNPAKHYTFTDTLHTGQLLNFSVAIENLTSIAMDSMLVRYKVIDANNASHVVGSKRYRKLPGSDTLNADFSFDPAAYPGLNLFYIEANPDNDQPEQYHPNNLGYIPFKLIADKVNPLVDVTFDGVHILNEDIVSAKPLIKILLKDENKYLALDDTSLLDVYMRYPQDLPNTKRKVPFDGSVCKFIPANVSTGKNEATIEYRPALTQDSTYELFVTGRDKSGNNVEGTTTDYSIAFNVFNTPSITNVLNYPNPFSTSTAFVFTVTGSQLPSQFKIQILTVTGKVVREITKGELGPLHIGRNITDYKWDGRDQYGQVLGNGVYLYRVVTTLNGSDMDHWNTGADKYFKHGYGKMYIMR
ncbi:putative type IX secretion system sortase PorU2 [Taibaiella soli]|uniref:Gingipain domain-containing protein n=1 Tax=Taibaiella soli TaxID=1649169 RepID=A0A2W2AXA2_9BACT|nr:C25 family cysteine peptidase [Taibaiella soli]PZF72348.1 hypothetical protein DN068_13415 [Taibaiella soli]